MLYNVTFDITDERTHLIPYIPHTAAFDEDMKTKRVCFADTIEHCIAALGSSHRNLYTGCEIIIRSVAEMTLDPQLFVTAQELFEEKRVPDALETGECWYLDEVDVTKEVYRIEDFMEEYDIAFSCITREDMDEIIKKYFPINPCNHLRVRESVEQAYHRVLEKMYKESRYKEADQFETDIAELPWARKIVISGLKMRKLE